MNENAVVQVSLYSCTQNLALDHSSLFNKVFDVIASFDANDVLFNDRSFVQIFRRIVSLITQRQDRKSHGYKY